MKYFNRELEIYSGLYQAIEQFKAENGEMSDKRKTLVLSLLRNKCSEIGIETGFMDCSDIDEIQQFLEIKKHQQEKIAAQRDEEAEKTASEINPQLYSVISQLTPDQIVKEENDTYRIIIKKLQCFQYDIIFHNASLSDPNVVNRDLSSCAFCHYELVKESSGYKLSFVYSDNIENTDEELNFRQFTVTFETVQISFERYPLEVEYWKYKVNPWQAMSDCFNQMVMMALNGIEINKKEEKLIPYAVSLADVIANGKEANAEPFYDLADELGFTINRNKNFMDDANDCKLWSRLVKEVRESQQEYKTKAETVYGAAYLNDIRNHITERMHEKGFEGQYPDFVQISYIKGPRLVSGGLLGPNLVYKQKTDCHIRCVESCDDGLKIDFICCCFMPQKKDSIHDDYLAGAYNNFCCSTAAVTAIINDVSFSDEGIPSIDDYIDIAVKKATGDKLSKEEKNNPYFKNHYYSKATNIFFALFFGFVLTGLLLLILFVPVLIISLFESDVSFFTEFPWGIVYLVISTIASLLIYLGGK